MPTFADTLKKNLTPELYSQVMDQLGDDVDLDMVPRSRLNKVIAQRNELRAQVPAASATSSGAEGDTDGDTTTPPATSKGAAVNVEELKKQLQTEKDAEILGIKMQFATLNKLRGSDAVDPELIWEANLLDKTKLSFDAKGELLGLDDLVKDLQKTKPFLFQAKKPPAGTGASGTGDNTPAVASKADFLKLTSEQQLAFKTAHNELFQTFMN